MDDRLRAILEDRTEWDRIVKILIPTAILQMEHCHLPGAKSEGGRAPVWVSAHDFVVDAIVKSIRTYSSEKGELIPYLRRAVRTLVMDRMERVISESRLLRPIEGLVVRSREGRRWPLEPFVDLENVPADVEQACGHSVVELMMRAESDLAGFMSAALAQVEYTGSTRIDWAAVAGSLNLSVHQVKLLRNRARLLLEHYNREPG